MKIKKVILVTVSWRCSKKGVPNILPNHCEKYLLKRYYLVKWKLSCYSLACIFHELEEMQVQKAGAE